MFGVEEIHVTLMNKKFIKRLGTCFEGKIVEI